MTLLICILLIGPVYADQDKIPVIIGFRDNLNNNLVHAQSAQDNMVRQNDGEIINNYHIINGVSALMTEDAIEVLSKNKDVLYIEPDIEVQVLEQPIEGSVINFAFEYPNQIIPWGVERVNATIVHPITKGSGIKIAVLDSGIDYTHPDLNDNYKGGYDFINYDNDPMDDYGHGTKVAGVIAAEDNSFGIVGVSPEASIYGVKVIRNDGAGYLSSVIQGIEWAIDNDMDIITMSLGTQIPSISFENAVNNAYNSGVLVVASAGNLGGNTPDTVVYPAKYDSVIAVSAIDRNNNLASFSSIGPAVELTAPGLFTTSTLMGGNYSSFSGTSAAAPYVSGVAALLMVLEPSLTNVQIRQQLQMGAIDLGGPGRDTKFGFGLTNAVIETPSLNVNIIENQNPIESDQNTPITVHVSSGSTPIANALVTVSTSGGNLNPATGTTNANGDFITTYTAPSVQTQTQFTISTIATKTGYIAESDSSTITVNPPTNTIPQLAMTLTKASNTLVSGQNTQLTAHVTSGISPVANAIVTISTSGGILNPTAGTTNANGDFITTYTAPTVQTPTQFTISASTTKAGYEAGVSNDVITINPVSTNLPESPHPYPNSYENTWTISEPGATQIRIHFSRLETEEYFDDLYIYDKNNVQIAIYNGNNDGIWTDWINGDSVKVRLISDGSIRKYGFIVDQIETRGTLATLETTIYKASDIVESDQNTPITVHVSSGSTPIANALVTVSTSGGNLNPATGTTNANGDFITTYTAPSVQTQTQFTISTIATKTGYIAESDSSTITVNPPTNTIPQLAMTLTKASNTLVSGQNTQLTAHVTSGISPVANAIVTISTSGGILNPTAGTTNANGDFITTYTAPTVQTPTQFTISASTTKAGYEAGVSNDVITINPVSTNLPESPHPYPNSYENTWTISEPGATQIRIHFSRLETEEYFDDLYIYDKNNVQIAIYNGNNDGIWTEWINGDTVKVRLISDGSIPKFGFVVDQIETRNV